MSQQQSQLQSRRAFFGIALGAMAALIARSLGAPDRVGANDNDPMIVGVENDGQSTTVLTGPADSITDVAFVVQGFGASGAGVLAKGHGFGLRADGQEGRGGQFTGAKAQVRLQPATAATHPSSGQRGDLFVDKSGRLWFCKGGSTWHRIS